MAKRRRAGGGALSDVTYEEVSLLFHLPLRTAAAELGVCATVLKKKCRDLGIQRWPCRKLNSMRRQLADSDQTPSQTKTCSVIPAPKSKSETVRSTKTRPARLVPIILPPKLASAVVQSPLVQNKESRKEAPPEEMKYYVPLEYDTKPFGKEDECTPLALQSIANCQSPQPIPMSFPDSSCQMVQLTEYNRTLAEYQQVIYRTTVLQKQLEHLSGSSSNTSSDDEFTTAFENESELVPQNQFQSPNF